MGSPNRAFSFDNQLRLGYGVYKMKFAIIADDLTGANDSGVQFANKGLRSTVIFDINDEEMNTDESDVVIFDTDSRGISQEDAYKRVYQTTEIVNKYPPLKYLYKKIDSTLRGNIGAEIDAILDVVPKDFAIIAPAYPIIGRTTINGEHLLHGKPINQTEIAKDPKSPVLESNIEKRLQLQSKRKTATISIKDLSIGKEHIYNLVNDYKNNNIELIVFDIENENDLKLLVKYFVSSAFNVLWVGSAGLAEHLVSAVAINNEGKKTYLSVNNQPVMIVAGSLSQATGKQVEYLKDKAGIAHIELNPVILFEPEKKLNEINRCQSKILSELIKGNDVVLYSGNKPEQITGAIENGKKQGLSTIEVSNEIADILGEIVKNIMNNITLSGLVLTGGDTAKAVSRHIGARGMELIKELETGIPFGYLIGTNNIAAITKAGAFGKEDSLLKAINFLKGDA